MDRTKADQIGMLATVMNCIYVSEIFTCNASDLAFNTKLLLLISNYKKHLYLEMMEKVNCDMDLEEIENELENVKVKIHKCSVKKEIDIDAQYDEYINWLYDENRDKGIRSGLVYLDKYLGNFQKGRLITVFARSGVLKTLAMEEDICIVLLAQANRIVDKKGGDMAVEKIDSSDIQDSARIEQDSDQVI